jgi:hypothetical protein
MDWLQDVAGPNFAPAALWTLLALLVLVIVLVIVRVVRSMTFGTFVAGGRNRKTRLAVMDAAAVDSQRRLVLVRRDDVEHLILIGGPTDVVVERDIRLHAPVRRPAPPPDQLAEAPPRPPAAPAAARPAPRPAEQPPRPVEPQLRPAEPQPALQNLVLQSARPQPAPPPPARPSAVRAAPTAPDLGVSTSRPAPAPTPPPAPAAPAARLKPLESPRAAEADAAKKQPKVPELSLEDEMNRLLGELSKK